MNKRPNPLRGIPKFDVALEQHLPQSRRRPVREGDEEFKKKEIVK
jgi:hypothetical protein